MRVRRIQGWTRAGLRLDRRPSSAMHCVRISKDCAGWCACPVKESQVKQRDARGPP